MNREITDIFKKSGAEIFGVCEFSSVGKSFNTKNASLIPQNAASIITFLFPYLTDCPDERNLSLYCIGADYHDIILKKLSEIAEKLKEIFPNNSFSCFCDNSPINEVKAAYLSGLGVLGKNGLIINKKYGSFCFIGEIVTDLEFESYSKPLGFCLDCKKCLNSCKAGALINNGGEVYLLDKSRCLSAITQKKGTLTEEQEALIKSGGLVWGCDDCSLNCPLSKNAEATYIDEFFVSPLYTLTQNELDSDISDRAYAYKGKEVLKRNLCIISSKDGNNTVK